MAEDRRDSRRSSRSSSPSNGFETDDVIGDEDEIDYHTALKQGLIQ